MERDLIKEIEALKEQRKALDATLNTLEAEYMRLNPTQNLQGNFYKNTNSLGTSKYYYIISHDTAGDGGILYIEFDYSDGSLSMQRTWCRDSSYFAYHARAIRKETFLKHFEQGHGIIQLLNNMLEDPADA